MKLSQADAERLAALEFAQELGVKMAQARLSISLAREMGASMAKEASVMGLFQAGRGALTGARALGGKLFSRLGSKGATQAAAGAGFRPWAGPVAQHGTVRSGIPGVRVGAPPAGGGGASWTPVGQHVRAAKASTGSVLPNAGKAAGGLSEQLGQAAGKAVSAVPWRRVLPWMAVGGAAYGLAKGIPWAARQLESTSNTPMAPSMGWSAVPYGYGYSPYGPGSENMGPG